MEERTRCLKKSTNQGCGFEPIGQGRQGLETLVLHYKKMETFRHRRGSPENINPEAFELRFDLMAPQSCWGVTEQTSD